MARPGRARGHTEEGERMAGINLADGLIRNIFLAGVGAVATGAEKTDQIVSDLVKKGELTVEQGKAVNEELTRKAKEVAHDGTDAALRSRLEAMTPEERADFAAKVAEMAASIDAKDEGAAGADKGEQA